MKIFISHQRKDAALALLISQRLATVHRVESYLDVVDDRLSLRGEDLANYIRAQMGRCTQLLAVVSEATKASQWVPWEIGVASEKEFPLATYCDSIGLVPEFLRAWPILSSDNAIDQYVVASRLAERTLMEATANRSVDRPRAASQAVFYRELRSRLNQ